MGCRLSTFHWPWVRPRPVKKPNLVCSDRKIWSNGLAWTWRKFQTTAFLYRIPLWPSRDHSGLHRQKETNTFYCTSTGRMCNIHVNEFNHKIRMKSWIQFDLMSSSILKYLTGSTFNNKMLLEKNFIWITCCFNPRFARESSANLLQACASTRPTTWHVATHTLCI